MALPIAAMFGVVVCSFEILVPWTKDAAVRKDGYLTEKSW